MSKLFHEPRTVSEAEPLVNGLDVTVREEELPQTVLPEAFAPNLARYMLPVVTRQELSELKNLGWSRIGVPITIAHEGKLLIAKLRPSAKLPDGAYAPPSETCMAKKVDGNEWLVESPRDVYGRGVREELGVDPNSLGLRAREKGAWSLSIWPVGATPELKQSYLLGVAPAGTISSEGLAVLQGFIPTEEVESIGFMEPAEIYGLDNLREGTVSWLDSVIERGLHEESYEQGLDMRFSPIDVANPVEWQDINLHNMNL